MSRKRQLAIGQQSSAFEDNTSTSTDQNNSSLDDGEVIESEMKRLRVAYNYDGTHGVRWAGETVAMDMDMEIPRARAVRSAYAETNAMLREFHYLRQLRKFQAERGRARVSYLVDEAGTMSALGRR